MTDTPLHEDSETAAEFHQDPRSKARIVGGTVEDFGIAILASASAIEIQRLPG